MKKTTPVATPVQGERTREVLVRTLLEHGPATAADLATRLGITPAGVRRHLDGLVADGILDSRDEYQSPHSQSQRGRPAKVFFMTDLGREKFSHSYDDLAISLLEFMKNQLGENSIAEFAKVRAKDLASKIRSTVKKNNGNINNDELVAGLKAAGFATTIHSHGVGVEICQRHCPVAHVAYLYPEICNEETRIFSELLGTHVQRLATIGEGDGVCTTFIPNLPKNNLNSSKKNLSLLTKKKEK